MDDPRVGFEVIARQDGPEETVLHAEVRSGDIALMVASDGAGYDVPALEDGSVGGGLYLWLPADGAVDDWHAKALEAGGHEVIAQEDTAWGTRRARVLDPEGHEWSVGTYRPGSTR